ncbi:hypothetical protein E1B28_013131 [Marasmius oreades]|uniref:Uncharacterized protein n=1 Tax=Marasmius oreades TaxID=181124 RepID=A0A9P7UNP8_9AGAR|nr:uncharacterized protein E1B28_013131 [Marasmius oreades]KAG7087151.1 hypothetical protein E1B28_013131 [Marasmius oreades]
MGVPKVYGTLHYPGSVASYPSPQSTFITPPLREPEVSGSKSFCSSLPAVPEVTSERKLRLAFEGHWQVIKSDNNIIPRDPIFPFPDTVGAGSVAPRYGSNVPCEVDEYFNVSQVALTVPESDFTFRQDFDGLLVDQKFHYSIQLDALLTPTTSLDLNSTASGMYDFAAASQQAPFAFFEESAIAGVGDTDTDSVASDEVDIYNNYLNYHDGDIVSDGESGMFDFQNNLFNNNTIGCAPYALQSNELNDSTNAHSAPHIYSYYNKAKASALADELLWYVEHAGYLRI